MKQLDSQDKVQHCAVATQRVDLTKKHPELLTATRSVYQTNHNHAAFCVRYVYGHHTFDKIPST